MKPSLLSRIAQNLKRQEASLTAWLRQAPLEEQQIRLGGLPAVELERHIHVLEEAIHKAEKNELGICTVCHEPVEEHLLETNYTSCICIEHFTGLEREQLEAELQLSQKVQQGLLPHTPPKIDGWTVAAFSQPASIVGGDYFDFLRFSDGSHAIVIADAMGKGIPASMLVASLQASLRIIIPESTSPHQVLERLNRLFLHHTQLTKFVSVIILKVASGSDAIAYANAGHNPPLIVGPGSASGDGMAALIPTGAAIGLVENATFSSRTVRIGSGETIFLYTDGVVEARRGDKEEFGEPLLRSFLAANAGAQPADLIRSLRKELTSFMAGEALFDDTTIVVVRKTG